MMRDILKKALFDAIQASPIGWIGMDYRTGYIWTRPILFEDFTYKGKAVQLLGWIGDQYIFLWLDQ